MTRMPFSGAVRPAHRVAHVVPLAGSLLLVSGAVLGALEPPAEQTALADAAAVFIGAAVAGVALGSFTSRLLVAAVAARRRRATVMGRVTGRTTLERPSQDRYVYQRVLRVEFPVGTERRALDWAPGEVFTSSQSWLERVDARYPDGSQVTVRYEPAHPGNATVGKAIGTTIGAVVFCLAFSAASFGLGWFTGGAAAASLGERAVPLEPALDEDTD